MFTTYNDFKNKFIRVIDATREYHKNIINKLEDVFDNIVLINLYDYPQLILEELEKESKLDWDDDVWDAVLNVNVDPNDVLEMILSKRVEKFCDDVLIEWKFIHNLPEEKILELSNMYLNEHDVRSNLINNIDAKDVASSVLFIGDLKVK